MKIGIGITTRNRRWILDKALKFHLRYLSLPSKLVIVDDASEELMEDADYYGNEIIKHNHITDFNYIYSKERLGIAKAKNRCVRALQGCDHIWLFDDDCWPQEHLWAEKWLRCMEGFDHSQFNAFFSHMEPTEAETPANVIEWNHCCGVCLHFSAKALDTLGGYDERAGLYGYEHAQISQRAAAAGLTGGFGPYVGPAQASDWIYALDIHWGWWQNPPQGCKSWAPLVSSCTTEEASAFEKNRFLLDNPPIKIPL